MMDVLGDLVARDRRHDEPLVRFAAGPSGAYTAHKFCTDAWKSANLFSYHGTGPGRTVTIADDREPPVLLSVFGAVLLGATVTVRDAGAVDTALLVADAADLDAWDVSPATSQIAYNGPPDDPGVAHFERDIWSENPTMPPDSPDPDDPALATDDRTFTHAELLGAARRVVDDHELTAEDRVAIRASLGEPGTVVAGVFAPLLAGSSIILSDGELTGTVAVGEQLSADERSLPPQAVEL